MTALAGPQKRGAEEHMRSCRSPLAGRRLTIADLSSSARDRDPAVRPANRQHGACSIFAPSRTEEARRKHRQREQAEEQRRIGELLRARYPHLFAGEPVPLARGTHQAILTKLSAAGISRSSVTAWLRAWMEQPAYLRAIIRREPRVNLEGRIVALPEFEDVQKARKSLERNRV